MSTAAPHFILFSESPRQTAEAEGGGIWRFVLESADGSERLEVIDQEPDVVGERLELLAVVRGLEALDQPSEVTLLTPSSYVWRGFHHGLQAWRRNGFRWEHFGAMAPVKDRDLWQRVDRALQYHRVRCRRWRLDGAHRSVPRQPRLLRHGDQSPRPPLSGGPRIAKPRLWPGRRWVALFRGLKGFARLLGRAAHFTFRAGICRIARSTA